MKFVKILIAMVFIILIGSGIYSAIYPYKQQSSQNKSDYTIPKNKVSTNLTNNTNTTNNNTTKIDNPKSDISVYLSEYPHGQAGVQKVRVYVKNNSNKDIRYIKANLFEKDKNGKIIKSDYTNDDSIIKAGAKQEIDTYFAFKLSESTLEVELDEVDFK